MNSLLGSPIGLDQTEPWKSLWNTAINPTQPTAYEVDQSPSGMRLNIDGPAGSGALAKCVINLGFAFSELDSTETITADDSAARAWIEIDDRYTDAAGYTYPGDLHIGVDGTVEIGDINGVWHAAGMRVTPLLANAATVVQLKRTYNWTAHTSSLLSLAVGGVVYPLPSSLWNLPAALLGWAKSQLVKQRQIDLNARGGFASVLWNQMNNATS